MKVIIRLIVCFEFRMSEILKGIGKHLIELIRIRLLVDNEGQRKYGIDYRYFLLNGVYRRGNR